MASSARTASFMALGIVLAGAPGLFAQENAMGTRVISAPDEAPERCRKLVAEAFGSAPAGAKLSITLAPFFDFGKMDADVYLYGCVPLDAKGRPHGQETLFERIHDSTKVKRTTPWTHGKREGIETEYENRWMKSETPWTNDAIHGVRRTYHRNGSVRAETTYVKGNTDGPSRTYDEAGRLVRESEAKNGRRQGDMIDYWPDTGRPKRVIPYVKGAVHGVVKQYYANGQLKLEAAYRDDARHGVEKHYDADGTLTRSRYWLEDEEVPKDVYGGRK